MSLNPKIFVSIIITGIFVALSVWMGKVYYQHNTISTEISVSEIEEKGSTGIPQIGGPFQLQDYNQHPRTDADFKGKFMMIYFGYSFCPDICPMGLSNMSQALLQLEDKAQQIYPLFITIDPKRDTHDHLKRYLSSFHPQFIGLTGTTQQIDEVKKAYRVYGEKISSSETGTDYIMDHTSIIYIMDRQGRFVAHFNHTTPSSEMVRVMNELIN